MPVQGQRDALGQRATTETEHSRLPAESKVATRQGNETAVGGKGIRPR